MTEKRLFDATGAYRLVVCSAVCLSGEGFKACQKEFSYVKIAVKQAVEN